MDTQHTVTVRKLDGYYLHQATFDSEQAAVDYMRAQRLSGSHAVIEMQPIPLIAS